MYEQDYVMRIISESIRFLKKILLDKDEISYEIKNKNYTDYLHEQLLEFIEKGQLNEAENFLFDNLDLKNKDHIVLSLDFYTRLNDMSNEYLESNDFSREEIQMGVQEIAKQFGITI
ncbi:MAG: DUF6483 family protein [Senegalia sp. (in: firmicutes)]|uniref:DUF6483 family protein n=1 Tax=Senegalia sp. (in: firmicutes) TaxID=1924098 RepID=UPI003F963F13